MRIMLISNYYPPFEIGGWGQLTYDVVQRLKQRQHDVLVLTSTHRRQELQHSEEEVRRVLHLESPNHVHYQPRYTLDYRRYESENRAIITHACREFAPDVIYINGMWNMSVSVAQTAESCLPGRVLYYMASYWPAEPDAHNAFWQDLPAGWKRLPKQTLGKVLQRVWLPHVRRNQLAFRLVLCVSDYLRQRIVAEAGIPEAQTRVVHNGIELADFPLRPLQPHTSPLKLLYAGRFSPDKGVHTVIESLGILKQKSLPLPISVSIVGSGAPAYEAHLQEMVARLNVSDWVQFHGFVPREEMPAILQQHDVLLFPSIWPEPLARMVQEAMACGLIVIGTETGGTPEILHHGQNGLTFPAGDAAALADQILWLSDHQPQWSTLAQAARHTVETRFTLDRMVTELESYFSSIIQHDAVPSL